MITFQPLDTPNMALASSVGMEFVEAPQQALDEFGQACSKLLGARQLLADSALSFPITKPAVVYWPSSFLATSLTTKQVEIINHHETPKVAEYCVAVQRQIAQVPIQENWERMQHLPSLFRRHGLAATFSTIPFPEVSGEWAGKEQEFWARESFAVRLAFMGSLLQRCGIQLHFIEAFRPPGVQEGMFRRRVRRTHQEHPDWPELELLNEAKSKTASSPRLASHKGGAAVDILLRDAVSGELLDFGHEYPDGGVLVFPRTPYVTERQWHNRQLLQVAAGLSDLTLYVGEDWHVSYGDNLASIDEFGVPRSEYVATYGPIKDFSRKTGEITEIYKPDELDIIFAIKQHSKKESIWNQH